jgi:hypothetical protein
VSSGWQRCSTATRQRGSTSSPVSPTPALLQRYFERVQPDPVDADATKARHIRESFLRLFETGIGLEMP